MKKVFILLTLHSLIINISYSQNTFRRQIDVSNDDLGISVCQTHDSGYIITGVTNNRYDSADIVLVKTNQTGDALWAKIYGDNRVEDSYCVQETYDNGFIISGMRRYGTNDDRAYIIKTNSIGDTIWTKILNGIYKKVIQTHDSSFILVGKESYATIKKLDNDGNVVWSKSYNYCKEYLDCIEISGNRIVLGGLSKSEVAPFSTTIDLLMTDAEGDSIWFKQYGGINIYDYLCIRQTFDKGFVLSATETIMMERPNIYLQKVDSMGNYQWSNIFGSQQSFDFAKSVVQSSDSCYLITGDSDDYGLFLLKTDHTGNFLWEKGYDYDSNVTFGNCIQNTFDDHLIITGIAMDKFPPSPRDILLIKTDNDGILSNISESQKAYEPQPLVFPNPNKGTFFIRLSGNDNNVEILDIKGQVIYNMNCKFNNSQFLKIESLDRGCYVIRIISADYLKTCTVFVTN
ncbi:MAG: T9SS type A sorting domain-containing protein [Bacteroidales bacterium]